MDAGGVEGERLPPVTVSFTLTREEYLAASRRATLERTWIRVSLATGVVVAVVGVVAHSLFAAVWGLIYVAALVLIAVALPPRTWRRTEQLRSELVVVLSDANVSVESLLGRSTTEWGYWARAKPSGPTMYRLIGTSGGGLLVPRRAFETPAQEQDFLALLRSHLGTGFDEP
jgi:hypothetical protein